MSKPCRTFIFGVTMKIWLFLFFCTVSVNVFAQQKTIDGIVFDKESKDRIAKVNVLNATTGKSVYNTFKGEFVIDAKPGGNPGRSAPADLLSREIFAEPARRFPVPRH